MSGEAFIDKAVTSLADFIRDNLPAQLRVVETAKGYDANTIEDPREVVGAFIPTLTSSPHVQVYDVGASPEGPDRLKVWHVDCSIIVSFAGDADIEAGEMRAREYMTALVNLIRDAGAYTLGDTVPSVWPTGVDPQFTLKDDSQIRHLFAMGVTVAIQDA